MTEKNKYAFSKYTILLLCLLSAVCDSSAESRVELTRPPTGYAFPMNSSGTIVAGFVKGADIKTIWINDVKVEVYKNGSFMTYARRDKKKKDFFVNVGIAEKSPPVIKRKVDIEESADTATQMLYRSIRPAAGPIELAPGDPLEISFSAEPKGSAFLKIPGIIGKTRMTESSPGFYEARFKAPVMAPKRKAGNIEFIYKHGNRSLKIPTKKQVILARNNQWPKKILVAGTRGKILSAPVNGSYWFIVQQGTELIATAQEGGLYRIKLGNTDAWIAKEDISVFRGFPKTVTVSKIKIGLEAKGMDEQVAASTDTVVIIKMRGGTIPPYVIEEIAKNKVRVRIYNSNLHLNWVPYGPDKGNALIYSVTRSIPQSKTVDVVITLNGPLEWGYWSRADKEKIEIRFKRKKQSHTPYKALDGLRVLLDPGHGGEHNGAICPSGMFEADINLRLAFGVAKSLEAMGAHVLFTRTLSTETLSLEQRADIARNIDADIFLSIHANDFAHWENPLEDGPWGYSFYYYHNSSLEFARVLERSFKQENLSGIKDNGVLWGDLHMVREVTVPSVLIEAGYVTFPWQEETLIKDDLFLEQYSRAISRAVAAYFTQ
ncbi:N-acetylmuramoyl-L-alanine amidase [Elusimicrobiota bacterium]